MHLRVNGRDASFDRADDGLLTFALPAGSSRIELRYRSDVWDPVGMTLTAATVLIVQYRITVARRKQVGPG